MRKRNIILGLILLLAAAPPGGAMAAACTRPDLTDGVPTRLGCLALRLYGPPPQPDGLLVVMVHGEGAAGRSGPVRTLPLWAPVVAQALPGAAVAALYRPGYGGMEGRVSAGSDGGRRDNWTAENADAVAEAIAALRERHHPGRVVALAHGGGAALVAAILGRQPGLVDRALLLACPCGGATSALGPLARSLDPMDSVARVPASTRVLAVTGSADRMAPAMAAQAYVAALTRRGIPARFELLPGAGHELTKDQFLAVVQQLAVFAR